MDEEAGLFVGDVEAIPSLQGQAEKAEHDGDFLHESTLSLSDY
jgi:hypothetical protein